MATTKKKTAKRRTVKPSKKKSQVQAFPENPPPEGFPTLPLGTGGFYGLDKNGNLVIYPFPANERYCKAGPPDKQLWTNT